MTSKNNNQQAEPQLAKGLADMTTEDTQSNSEPSNKEPEKHPGLWMTLRAHPWLYLGTLLIMIVILHTFYLRTDVTNSLSLYSAIGASSFLITLIKSQDALGDAADRASHRRPAAASLAIAMAVFTVGWMILRYLPAGSGWQSLAGTFIGIGFWIGTVRALNTFLAGIK